MLIKGNSQLETVRLLREKVLHVDESQSESSTWQSHVGEKKKAPSAVLGSSFNNKVLSSPWTLILCAVIAPLEGCSRLRGVMYFSSAGDNFSTRIPTATDRSVAQHTRLIPGPEITAEQLQPQRWHTVKGLRWWTGQSGQSWKAAVTYKSHTSQQADWAFINTSSVLYSPAWRVFFPPCCSHYSSLSRDMFGSDTSNWDKKSKRDSYGSFVKNKIPLNARGWYPDRRWCVRSFWLCLLTGLKLSFLHLSALISVNNCFLTSGKMKSRSWVANLKHCDGVALI